jgi:hypothetical protein
MKKYNWYLDPLDSDTNDAIRRLKISHGSPDDGREDMLCSDGKRRNLWCCNYDFIARFLRSQVSNNFRFEIYLQSGEGNPPMRWVPFSRKKRKIVFIAHPVKSDPERNIRDIISISREIYKSYKNVIPFPAYLATLQYLKDYIEEERQFGMEAVAELMFRKCFDEIWLYGVSISEGMVTIILLARKLGIPVVAKSDGTRRDLQKLL